jgi:ABC-type spermidine/putrescine transport system permease subunit II
MRDLYMRFWTGVSIGLVLTLLLVPIGLVVVESFKHTPAFP